MTDQENQGPGAGEPPGSPPPPPPPAGEASWGSAHQPPTGQQPPPAQWPTQQPGPQPAQTWAPAGPARTNGYALAALILGIAGFVVIPLIGHILAIVFGYTGKGQIDRSGGVEEGRGMAVAGIVLGWIGIALSVIVIVIVIIVAVFVANNGGKIIINGTPVTFSPG